MKSTLKLLVLSLVLTLTSVQTSTAAVGISYGLGAPYVSQPGLDLTLSDSFSIVARANSFGIDLGEASVDLNMPEVSVLWHPFSGSFFLGLGVGSQTLDVSSTNAVSGLTASTEVTTTAMLAKLGWMWGKGNGGFWGGMDVTFVSPSSSDYEIEAPGLATTSEEYQDVEDAAEQFGETAYVNFTFLRLGYLF
ncbi:MAG: hypothetical protein CME65_02715 [Halobacteriovoraceae bacterium]|nr:hypothetical protein [Halobacteriovoraceae bacterium]|tara:strand:+ start:4786 stop:5361 length:576 start_codon:yes stop_codon:yes gene_type:complete